MIRITTSMVEEIQKLKVEAGNEYGLSREKAQEQKPLFYMENGIIKVCGVLNIQKYKRTAFYTGTFILPQPNGNSIGIENVLEYYIFIKQENGKFKYLHNPDILEKEDMEDIYILAIKPMPSCSFSAKDDWLYEMCLYHNEVLEFSHKNVCRKIHRRDNVNLIYTTKNEKDKKSDKINKYDYWMYYNNEAIKIGEGNEADAWISSISDMKEYDNLLQYKTSKDTIDIYFHGDGKDSYYVALEYAKQTADEFELIDNLFEDDDSINHVARYKKERIDDIAVAVGVIGPNGTCVYGYTIDDIIKGLEKSGMRAYFDNINTDIKGDYEYYKSVIEYIYSRLKLEADFTKVPEKFAQYLISMEKQREFLLDFLNKNHSAYIYDNKGTNRKNALERWEETGDTSLFSKMNDLDKTQMIELRSRINNRRKEIWSKLLLEGLISPKWKSEAEMYKLLRNEYKDAVFQYNTSWLGLQRIDVFVPCLGIAFEYQGIQHYQPVELFGGKEHFEKGIELDKKKRLLCKEHGIIVIDWRYDEPITTAMLKRKLQNIAEGP